MLLPLLMPRLNLGTMAHMDGPIMVATTGTERDLLTQSPLQWLMPRLSHGGMDTTDIHGLTMVMPTMERDLLTLNQLLLPMPRQSRGGMDTTDTHGHTTVMPTMERGLLTLNQLLLLMQRLSHGIMAAMDTVGHTMVTTGVKLSTSSVTRQALSQDHA